MKKVEDLQNQLAHSHQMEEIRRLLEDLPSLKDLDPDHPCLKDKKKEDL